MKATLGIADLYLSPTTLYIVIAEPVLFLLRFLPSDPQQSFNRKWENNHLNEHYIVCFYFWSFYFQLVLILANISNPCHCSYTSHNLNDCYLWPNSPESLVEFYISFFPASNIFTLMVILKIERYLALGSRNLLVTRSAGTWKIKTLRQVHINTLQRRAINFLILKL